VVDEVFGEPHVLERLAGSGDSPIQSDVVTMPIVAKRCEDVIGVDPAEHVTQQEAQLLLMPLESTFRQVEEVQIAFRHTEASHRCDRFSPAYGTEIW
jgi:hypothetical protein